jgi:hypothetical protein
MASRGSGTVGLSPVAGVARMAAPAPRPFSSSVTLQARGVLKPDRPERHTPLSPSTHFSAHDHQETTAPFMRSAQSSRLLEIAMSAVATPLKGSSQTVSQHHSDSSGAVSELGYAAVLVETQAVPSAADLLLGETISRYERLKRARRAKSDSAPPVIDASAAYLESQVVEPLSDMQFTKDMPPVAIAPPSSSSQSPGPSPQAPPSGTFMIDDIVSVIIDRAHHRSPVSPLCTPATEDGVVNGAAATATTTATATEFIPPDGVQAAIVMGPDAAIDREKENDETVTSTVLFSQSSSDTGQSHSKASAAPVRPILPHVALHLAAAQSLREVIDAKIRSSLQHAHDLSVAAVQLQATRESSPEIARESETVDLASNPVPSKAATVVTSAVSSVLVPAPQSCDEKEDLSTAAEPSIHSGAVGLNFEFMAPSSSSLGAIDTSCMQTCASDTAGDSMRSRGPEDFTDDDAAASTASISSPVFASNARRTDSFTESIAFNPCIISSVATMGRKALLSEASMASMASIDRISPLTEALEPRGNAHEARAVYWPSALVHPSLLPDAVLVPDLVSPSTLRRPNRFMSATGIIKGRQEMPMFKADSSVLSPSRRQTGHVSPTPLPSGASVSLLLKTVMSPRRGGEH